MLEKVLLPYVRDESRPTATPSAYWSTYVLTELIKRGHEEEVVAFIRRRWRPMAEFGSTFEHWDPPRGDGSRSHAWSAHPLFHLMNTIGGVRQSAPAWREILLRRFSSALKAVRRSPRRRVPSSATGKSAGRIIRSNWTCRRKSAARSVCPAGKRKRSRGDRWAWLLAEALRISADGMVGSRGIGGKKKSAHPAASLLTSSPTYTHSVPGWSSATPMA